MSSNLRFTETLRYDTYTSHSYSSSSGNQARIPRRRKRPSNRTREKKPMSRYDDYSDSIDLALDTQVAIPRPGSNSNFNHSTIHVPSISSMPSGNKTAPSPMMRKNFDQSWFMWKEREFKREKEEMEAMRQRECERKRVFGGDCGVGEGVDDVLLCPKMLEVVRFLFGGDIDFGYLDSGD